MVILEWMINNPVLVVGPLFIVVIFGLFVVLISLLDIIIRRYLFRRDVSNGIKHGDLVWEQVCDFAKLRNLTLHVAIHVIMKFKRKILVSPDKKGDAQIKIKKLDEYIAEYHKDSPFDGLPEETRLLLNDLRNKLGGKAEPLHQLASHMREQLRSREWKYRRQGFYTFGGFVLAVVALIVTFYIYYNPLPTVDEAVSAPHSFSSQTTATTE